MKELHKNYQTNINEVPHKYCREGIKRLYKEIEKWAKQNASNFDITVLQNRRNKKKRKKKRKKKKKEKKEKKKEKERKRKLELYFLNP